MKGTQNAGGATGQSSMKGAQSQNQMQGSNPYGSGGINQQYAQQNMGLYTGSPQGQGFQGQGQGFNGMQGPMGLGSSQSNPGNPALGGGMRSGPITNGNALQASFNGNAANQAAAGQAMAQPSYLFQPQAVHNG
jgi:hypothetical protein